MKDVSDGEVLQWRREGAADEASDAEDGDELVSLV